MASNQRDPVIKRTRNDEADLVKRVIERLKKRPTATEAVGASSMALDHLESKLMVELPPSLRTFLGFDFTFITLGKRFQGRGRFGADPKAPRPRITSVRKLAEAKTELGWTDSRIRSKVVRLPGLPGQPWNALYLGEARRDGELPIIGLENEDTNVRAYVRYTAFDLYLCEQSGLLALNESQRLDDLESHVAANPELGSGEEEDDGETDY
ncbi:MAG: SMI1/KNR4 family protein [Byssovorax sp.]